MCYLSAAYNENPNDLETFKHLGFTHMWALSERQKLYVIPPTIIDHGTLALKYYGESYKLNPNDPRILGFLADAKMTVAAISDDKKLTIDGYFNGKKSINQWKEFNYFTIGYFLSQLHQDTWQFKKALECGPKDYESYCNLGNIFQEMYKRFVIPFYLPVLILISLLLIINSKESLTNYE